VKIIFITSDRDTDFVTAAFDVGAEGYVRKDCVSRNLRRGIDAVLRGSRYISNQS